MKKKLGIVLIALALSVMMAATALAAWKQDDKGWWYQNDDGSFLKNGIKDVSGKNYCFDSNGYMQTGWQNVNWKWYYFDNSGFMQTGWVQLDGKWYYLDPEDGGAMKTYWLDLPDPHKKGDYKRYYLDENGVLLTGSFYLSDGTEGSGFAYKTDDSGALIRNKEEKIGNTQMRYDDDGIISFRNQNTIDGAKKDGSSEWQYLLSQSELDRIKQSQLAHQN